MLRIYISSNASCAFIFFIDYLGQLTIDVFFILSLYKQFAPHQRQLLKFFACFIKQFFIEQLYSTIYIYSTFLSSVLSTLLRFNSSNFHTVFPFQRFDVNKTIYLADASHYYHFTVLLLH